MPTPRYVPPLAQWVAEDQMSTFNQMCFCSQCAFSFFYIYNTSKRPGDLIVVYNFEFLYLLLIGAEALRQACFCWATIIRLSEYKGEVFVKKKTSSSTTYISLVLLSVCLTGVVERVEVGQLPSDLSLSHSLSLCLSLSLSLYLSLWG